MPTIDSIEQLEEIYGTPVEASIVKVSREITEDYRALIQASPFLTLATCGPEGLDCSPRGDEPGFVRVVDSTTLQLPDRRGNNRVDSLRNIVRDPRVGLLFLIPGCGKTIRVNGQAKLNIDPEVLESFAVEAKTPRCVLEISVEEVYFQCARAIMRSKIWQQESHVNENSLPSAGRILANLSENRVGGKEYDCEWLDRAKKTLW